MTENYFTELNAVDVSSKSGEEKRADVSLLGSGLGVRSRSRHPDATYTVYETGRAGSITRTENVLGEDRRDGERSGAH